jgi:CheY-like chemotaxis protein
MRSISIQGRRCRALVVDDNSTNRLVLNVMLTEVGGEVSEAGDGLVAVEAFRKGGFDVVLMDVEMPRMDGLAATRAIRVLEEQQGLARTPIIVVSAFVTRADREASCAAGADLHLPKPIDMNALLDAVGDAVQGASCAQQDGPRYAVG